MSTPIQPYFVEVDRNGCSKCGHGRLWLVIGPDGYGGSGSYSDYEDADKLAEDLNNAYAAGVASVVKNKPATGISPEAPK